MNTVKLKKMFFRSSFLFFMISMIISFWVSTAYAEGSCYFCDNNQCKQASGSGWTGCQTGNQTCGFYGNSCLGFF